MVVRVWRGSGLSTRTPLWGECSVFSFQRGRLVWWEACRDICGVCFAVVKAPPNTPKSPKEHKDFLRALRVLLWWIKDVLPGTSGYKVHHRAHRVHGVFEYESLRCFRWLQTYSCTELFQVLRTVVIPAKAVVIPAQERHPRLRSGTGTRGQSKFLGPRLRGDDGGVCVCAVC